VAEEASIHLDYGPGRRLTLADLRAVLVMLEDSADVPGCARLVDLALMTQDRLQIQVEWDLKAAGEEED
jgi:hypothetical protein